MIVKMKLKYIYICIVLMCILGFSALINISAQTTISTSKPKFIKWVEFNIPYSAMDKALRYDIDSHSKDIRLNWIEILSYLGTKYGGDFSRYKEKHMVELVKKLEKGDTIQNLTEKMKYYDYYWEAYSAVLGGMVGEYEIEIDKEDNPEEKIWVKKYGLKAFSPIAKGYDYSHYKDFGASRGYGYKRLHLGNDLLGQVGTPIIAIESGAVEALGWNQYGGWRIGIRSFDKKRYYYYAHLRKNFPYNKSLTEGCIVTAGDVIGYLGRTGYSTTENVNNIETPHLHFGMQLIFDESQKESNNEIWIDVYNIINLLHRNKSSTIKNPETKDYHRVYNIKDPVVPISPISPITP